MALENPQELNRSDRRRKRDKQRRTAQRREKGDSRHAMNNECLPDLAEKFNQYFAEFENSADSTHFERLRERGISLPNSNKLTDEQLHAKLWEVIGILAEMNVFLHSTDHLNDRELYELLWSDLLHEAATDPAIPNVHCQIDLVNSGSDKDIANWLRYYANADDRARWQRNFPGDVLPPRKKPPFSRDHRLPRPRE
jgi:hypothetical protein